MLGSLAQGEITFGTGVILLVLALVSGAIGGAIGGIIVGGKALGNELAAMMGAFFGPIASIPGVAAALVILALLL
ncbi:hypothetical protein [Nitrospira moscoviensis]|uniref:Uncharacterized protein n=1 Tax=Nitrospira moscoviensis TaxID=42253 RepID=A0A088NAA2_NITMO|nr:hypothetical protein [Nitrospira moscoviensis]AIN51363.1 hypothetical protein [Nitrospira moscoviensis]ALA58069.1 hypothetical protein NITMOv2_1645 [Nitrospira moscoviensis]